MKEDLRRKRSEGYHATDFSGWQHCVFVESPETRLCERSEAISQFIIA
jgi:hypothetical protein